MIARSDLTNAVIRRNTAEVSRLLANGADANAQDEYGETPLFYACSKGDIELVKLLLAAKAHVNVQVRGVGDTPLIKASESGNVELVKLLLAANAEVNPKTEYGQTALVRAYQVGRNDVVKLLIAVNADVNARTTDIEASTPLFMACDRGDIDVVRMLIAAGADVNARMLEGMTALWMASCRGNLELVQMLVAGKADVNARTDSGQSALDVASGKMQIEVVKLLREAGAKDAIPEVKQGLSDNDLDELLGTIVRSQPEEMKKLLDAKPELVNYRSSHHGHTALISAAMSTGDRGAAAIRNLLDRGADPDIQANNGFTALYHAASRGNGECVRILLAAGADPRIPVFSGKTAIEIADANGHQQIVSMLASAPAPSHRVPSTSVAAGAIPKWTDRPIPRALALPTSKAPSGARKLGCGLTSLVLLAPTLAFIVLANTTEWGTSPTMAVVWLAATGLAIVVLALVAAKKR